MTPTAPTPPRLPLRRRTGAWCAWKSSSVGCCASASSRAWRSSLVGLVLIFVHHPELLSSATRNCRNSRSAAPVFPHTLSEVFQGALQTRGEAIVAVGLLLLILTPVTRVAVSILAFLYQRDRVFTFITLTVLIILLMSFVIGRLE